MKEITVKVYDITELQDEAKKKALEEFRDINTSEHSYWYRFLMVHFKGLLKDKGYDDPQLLFTGFYSQGDGACFTSSFVDLVKWIKKENNKYNRLAKLIKAGRILIDVSRVYKTNFQYSHACSVSFYLNWCMADCNEEAVAETDYPNITSLMDALEEDIKKDIVSNSISFYEILQETYESLKEDASVEEALIANKYTFTEDGKYFPYS